MPRLYLIHGPVECQMELVRLHLLNERFDILGDTLAWFLAERKIGGSIISVFPPHLDGEAAVQPAAVGKMWEQLAHYHLYSSLIVVAVYIFSCLMSTTTYECDRKLFYNESWAGTIPSLPTVLNMETVLCFLCTDVMMNVAGLQIRLCEKPPKKKRLKKTQLPFHRFIVVGFKIKKNIQTEGTHHDQHHTSTHSKITPIPVFFSLWLMSNKNLCM